MASNLYAPSLGIQNKLYRHVLKGKYNLYSREIQSVYSENTSCICRKYKSETPLFKGLFSVISVFEHVILRVLVYSSV